MSNKHDVSIQIKIPATIKKKILRVAFKREETMKTFILKSLQKNGIEIPENLIVDQRKVK